MKLRSVPILALLFSSGLFLTSCNKQPAGPKLETPYQAVLLSSGHLYFGKLEGLGTPYPILRDVYYVQSQTNVETKQVANTLVKRGKEWHGPDRMYLNASQIILVEPVSPNSRVADLIRQSQ